MVDYLRRWCEGVKDNVFVEFEEDWLDFRHSEPLYGNTAERFDDSVKTAKTDCVDLVSNNPTSAVTSLSATALKRLVNSRNPGDAAHLYSLLTEHIDIFYPYDIFVWIVKVRVELAPLDWDLVGGQSLRNEYFAEMDCRANIMYEMELGDDYDPDDLIDFPRYSFIRIKGTLPEMIEFIKSDTVRDCAIECVYNP